MSKENPRLLNIRTN